MYYLIEAACKSIHCDIWIIIYDFYTRLIHHNLLKIIHLYLQTANKPIYDIMLTINFINVKRVSLFSYCYMCKLRTANQSIGYNVIKKRYSVYSNDLKLCSMCILSHIGLLYPFNVYEDY
jgi:hypothetical protein